MKIWVDRLKNEPEPISYAPGAEWWGERFEEDSGGEIRLVEPPVFQASVALKGDEVDLRGGFEATLETECGRCLRRYRLPLQDSFHLGLDPYGESVDLDPEGLQSLAKVGICLGEELDSGWYKGNELELDGFLTELISLALPLQFICSEDCLGLCSQCGIDRSQASCECKMPKPKSPFAVLEALREKETGSS